MSQTKEAGDQFISQAPRERWWEGRFPESDLVIYREAGYGKQITLGTKPVLLVVDATINFTGDQREPIGESIRRFPDSCGIAAWETLPVIRELVRTCRDAEVLVIYTRGPEEKSQFTLGGWARSRTRMSQVTDDTIGESFLEDIRPESTDVVIEKRRPSAFFETPLTSLLIDSGIDTVVLAGATTSGCVRASAVEAFSLGFRVAVVEDATFDRSELSRDVSLFELDRKYAQVISSSSAVRYFRAQSTRSAGERSTKQ